MPGQLGCLTGGRPDVWEELVSVNWLIKAGDMGLIQGLLCIPLVLHCIDKHWQLTMHIADSIYPWKVNKWITVWTHGKQQFSFYLENNPV